MSDSEQMSTWNNIQSGVKETERFMGQKDYNASMVKARQTLECMVKSLAAKHGLSEMDMAESIDELYRRRIITKTTCEHYHKIRITGNKAVHDGDNNAYNANTAYHLLSQEVYSFARDYSPKKSRFRRSERNKERSSEMQTDSGDRTPRRRRRKVPSSKMNPSAVLIAGGGLLVLIIIIVLIMIFNKPKKQEIAETTQPVTTAESMTTANNTVEVETTVAPTTEAYKKYKTTTENVNIRSEPNTDNPAVKSLNNATVVEYVQAYDEEWSEVIYDGKTYYIATRYITPIEED